MMSLSASFTKRPTSVRPKSSVPTSLVNLPASSTGLSSGSLSRWRSEKSSVPKPGTVLGADVVREPDLAGVLALGHRDLRERAFVAQALERRAGQRRDALRALAEQRLDAIRAEDQVLLAVAREDVVQLAAGRDGHVARQRPRRGGPDQQRERTFDRAQRTASLDVLAIQLRLPLRRRDPEPHVHAGILHVLVPERDLVIAQARLAVRAVPEHLEVLAQQALAVGAARGVDARQDGPAALDVLALAGDVGVLVVQPVGHA